MRMERAWIAAPPSAAPAAIDNAIPNRAFMIVSMSSHVAGGFLVGA